MSEISTRKRINELYDKIADLEAQPYSVGRDGRVAKLEAEIDKLTASLPVPKEEEYKEYDPNESNYKGHLDKGKAADWWKEGGEAPY